MDLIYIVDDDENLCKILELQLKSEGYEVYAYTHARDLLHAFETRPCDLIISDIMMPEINGYELCKEIRSMSNIPFMMLSAKDEEIDRILGLELGSDDYITKPFSLREVTIKVRNLLRRYKGSSVNTQNTLRCCDFSLEIESRQGHIQGEIIELTAKEFDLLEFFLINKNHAFSREQLIEKIWGYDYYGDTRQVDHIIKRIRKKLLLFNSEFRIETVWGFGYKVSD